MGGEGAMSGMITSLKNNKIMLGERKKLFSYKDAIKQKYKKRKTTDHKKMSAAELYKFRKKLRRENLRTNIIIMTVFIVVLGIVGVGYYYLIGQ